MMRMSQMKPTNRPFDLPSVPNQGSLISYHRGRLKVTPAYASKGGSASLHSERQLKPSVTYLTDREISFQFNPVAQRTSRVAKPLGRWINNANHKK